MIGVDGNTHALQFSGIEIPHIVTNNEELPHYFAQITCHSFCLWCLFDHIFRPHLRRSKLTSNEGLIFAKYGPPLHSDCGDLKHSLSGFSTWMRINLEIDHHCYRK